MKKASQKEDGVSPVVGVMLMLVVTIVIAALVSAFAGGMADSQEVAPTAALSVSMSAAVVPGPQNQNSYSSYPEYYVHIENLGGDDLKTNELRIVTTYTVPTVYQTKYSPNKGKTIKHTIDGSLDRISANYLDESIAGYPFTPQTNTIEGNIYATQFMLSEAASHMDGATLRSGQTITIPKKEFLGFDVDDKNKYGFLDGAIVHVTITHIPSNKVIYDQDVTATW